MTPQISIKQANEANEPLTFCFAGRQWRRFDIRPSSDRKIKRSLLKGYQLNIGHSNIYQHCGCDVVENVSFRPVIPTLQVRAAEFS